MAMDNHCPACQVASGPVSDAGVFCCVGCIVYTFEHSHGLARRVHDERGLPLTCPAEVTRKAVGEADVLGSERPTSEPRVRGSETELAPEERIVQTEATGQGGRRRRKEKHEFLAQHL